MATTAELTKDMGDVKQKQSAMKERLDLCCDRVEKVEKAQEEHGRMLITIEKLANGIEAIKESVSDLRVDVKGVSGRVAQIEQKPGKRWDAIVEKVIWMIVAGFVGYLLSQLGIGA